LSLLLCLQVPAQAPASSQSQDGAVRPDPKRAQKAAEQGDRAIAAGRFDLALAQYEEGARYAPQDAAIIEKAAELRSKLVRALVDAAERDALAGLMIQATEELAAAIQIDPGNTVVRERFAQFKSMEDQPVARPKPAPAISGLPRLQPQPGKRNLDLSGDSKEVYEKFAGLFGVKAVFEPDLAPRRARLRVDDVDFSTRVFLRARPPGHYCRRSRHHCQFVAPI